MLTPHTATPPHPTAKTRRTTWTPQADVYVPAELRAEFLAAADRSIWAAVTGSHRGPRALDVQELSVLFGRAGMAALDQVAHSQAWVVPDATEATILGARSTRIGLTFYLLDIGVRIEPIAFIVDDIEEPRTGRPVVLHPERGGA
jgi:hypothetical protein